MSLSDYVNETKGELRHVNWPTGNQATQYTILVIGISLFVAAYLGLFDGIFSYLLRTLILH